MSGNVPVQPVRLDRDGVRGVDPKHALIDWPGFADLARAMGGYGLIARSVGDLEQIAEHVHDGRLPLLVDIKTDPAVRIGDIR